MATDARQRTTFAYEAFLVVAARPQGPRRRGLTRSRRAAAAAVFPRRVVVLSSRHMGSGDDSSTLSVLRSIAPGDPRPAVAETFPPLYRTFRAASSLLLRGLFGLRVHGVEHLP